MKYSYTFLRIFTLKKNQLLRFKPTIYHLSRRSSVTLQTKKQFYTDTYDTYQETINFEITNTVTLY